MSAPTAAQVHVVLPVHLRRLAGVTGDGCDVTVHGAVTLGAVLDQVEAAYPSLRGAIREHDGGRRRPFVRFFACEQDLSHDGYDVALPPAVAAGSEPLLVVGAMAGG
jgi:molybdopterin synthase sulfur carrier subunit